MTLNKAKSKKKNIEEVFQGLLEHYDLETVEQVALNMLGLSLNDGKKQEVSPITFGEALTKFYGSGKYIGLSESSQLSYQSELKLLNSYIKKNTPKGEETLFTDIIYPTSFLVEYLNKTKIQSTKNKKTAVLRTFIKTVLRDFYEQNKEDFDYSLQLNWQKNTLPKGYSSEQIEELLILSKRSPYGLRNYTMLILFLGMGIRVSELVGIQIKDINLEGFVSVRPKRQKHKLVATPIHDNALKVLLSYVGFTYGHLAENWDDLKAKYGKYYVFPRNDNPEKPITTRAVELVVKKLVFQAKSISREEAEKFSCHSFRHSFAQFSVRSGINLAAVAKLLNHSGLAAVMVYANQTKEQLREDLQKHVLADFQIDYLNKGGFRNE